MFDIYFELIKVDPLLASKNCMRFLHFISLALGIGGATILDFIILKFFFNNTIKQDQINFFNFTSKIINYSLIAVWITGIGFLIQYYYFDPVKLTNPKIYMKLTVVTILTLNGIFIHYAILPTINKQVGKTIFEGLDENKKFLFSLSASISATSWYTAVALGAFSQLNFKVPYSVLLFTYFTIMMVIFVSINAVMSILIPDSNEEKNIIITGNKFSFWSEFNKINASVYNVFSKILPKFGKNFTHMIPVRLKSQERDVNLAKRNEDTVPGANLFISLSSIVTGFTSTIRSVLPNGNWNFTHLVPVMVAPARQQKSNDQSFNQDINMFAIDSSTENDEAFIQPNSNAGHVML
jgi:hypothetical protein